MTPIALLVFGLVLLGQTAPVTESALSASPTGWVDLLADRSLKDWVRVPLSENRFVRAGDTGAPSPWTVDASGVLACAGDKSGHEMLRYATELGDHVLHVEWRFVKIDGDPAYNAGVFVRTAADGTIWHQAQTGATGGFLFANIPVNGTLQRVNMREQMTENRVKPAGEWNTYEVTAKGPTITLWVNGAVTSTFEKTDVLRGFVGFEAEGFKVEFRNVKLKKLD